jgi:coenzyme F420-reducing hydrogenase beta subunit
LCTQKRSLTLHEYLAVPPPRTMQFDRVRAMLARQHGLDADDVVAIDFEKGRFDKFM